MEKVSSTKFSKLIYTCSDGLRFATPEIVAQYRAGRLQTEVLADISCGIGGQTIFFARECQKVYGVDIAGDKLECAQKNANLYDLGNIIFIEGDALSPDTVKQVTDADIIFSDPARPAAETVRQTDSLRPGIPMVLDVYKDITDKFAFEAPPQIPPERIDFDCEREYISVDGKLNRLTLYFGPLKQCERSAVVLEDTAFHRLKSKDRSQLPQISEIAEPKMYAFEPDPAVVKAGLLGELVLELKQPLEIVPIDAKRILLTSDILIESPFLKNTFQLIGKVPYDCRQINSFLQGTDIGSAVIRFIIAPEKYWDIRNKIEKDLAGGKTAHLFKISRSIYLFENLRT
ncbi:MAG TPA: class I SAM-dependent methyltransferase [Candidatus Nanoarchaeia archaeon]|nr:class I SAM-dependent methyltransferase [Candidatus Nanoarchaeia archaeon]